MNIAFSFSLSLSHTYTHAFIICAYSHMYTYIYIAVHIHSRAPGENNTWKKKTSENLKKRIFILFTLHSFLVHFSGFYCGYLIFVHLYNF